MRGRNGASARGATAAAALWEIMVIMQIAMEEIMNGIFSVNKAKLFVEERGTGEAADLTDCVALLWLPNWKRRKGQKSNRKRTKGQVTSIGLVISPKAKKKKDREIIIRRKRSRRPCVRRSRRPTRHSMGEGQKWQQHKRCAMGSRSGNRAWQRAAEY